MIRRRRDLTKERYLVPSTPEVLVDSMRIVAGGGGRVGIPPALRGNGYKGGGGIEVNIRPS